MMPYSPGDQIEVSVQGYDFDIGSKRIWIAGTVVNVTKFRTRVRFLMKNGVPLIRPFAENQVRYPKKETNQCPTN